MRFIIITTFIFLPIILKAQDILMLKNGDEIKIKTLEITETNVKYKKWNNLDGPIYSQDKKNIVKIVYENGSIEEFKKEAEPEDDEKQAAVLKARDYMLQEIDNLGLRFVEYTKLNGAIVNISGQDMYCINFRLRVQCTNTGWVYADFTNNKYPEGLKFFNLERPAYVTDSFHFGPGLELEIIGVDTSVKTDNGYEHGKYFIKTIEIKGGKRSASPVFGRKYFHIITMQTGKALSLQNTTNFIELSNIAETDDQLFSFEGHNYYTIYSKKTGVPLEIPGSDNKQQFLINKQGEDYYRLVSSNSNKALAVESSGNAGVLRLTKGTGADNQLFNFIVSGEASSRHTHYEPQWRANIKNEETNVGVAEINVLAMINEKYNFQSRMLETTIIDSFKAKYWDKADKNRFYNFTNVNKKKLFVRLNRSEHAVNHLWERYDYYNGILVSTETKPNEAYDGIINFGIKFLYIDKNGDLIVNRCITLPEGNIENTESVFYKKKD
ncbi:MAG: RICIN domain-containing protein [Ferruginibacter sp.]